MKRSVTLEMASKVSDSVSAGAGFRQRRQSCDIESDDRPRQAVRDCTSTASR